MNILIATRPAPPEAGMIRVGPVASIREILRERGVDAQPILESFGLPMQFFEDPDATMRFETLCKLLAACAHATACPQLGLLIGQRGGLGTLGALGFLMQNAPDVQTALHELVRNINVHDRGAAPRLDVAQHLAWLGYDIFQPSVKGSSLVSDAALAIGYKFMQELCGSRFALREVHFRHTRPTDVVPYRRFFQAPLHFEAERSALVFDATWLAAPIPLSNPQLRRHFEAYVKSLASRLQRNFQDQAYPVILRLMSEGRCSQESLADALALHPRTLNRRLQATGTDYRALHTRARHEVALEMLRDTTNDVDTIANVLGYSSGSAFNRAFSGWEGMPPVKWRRQSAAAG